MRLTNKNAVLIIAVLTFIVFANTLKNDFVFDDRYVIIKNPVIQKLDLREIFTSNYVPTTDTSIAPGYRPITTLTFAIDYQIAKLTPLFYHLINILIHSFNAILAFLIALKILNNKISAIFASLVFALHPVQTEAVDAVVGRADLLSVGFAFIAFLIHIKYENYKNRFSLIFYFLSLFCKETSILLPGVIVFYDFAFRHKKIKALLKSNGLYYIEYALTALLFTVIRMPIVGLFSAGIPFLDNPIASESFGIRLLNFPIMYLNYLQLLFFRTEC